MAGTWRLGVKALAGESASQVHIWNRRVHRNSSNPRSTHFHTASPGLEADGGVWTCHKWQIFLKHLFPAPQNLQSTGRKISQNARMAKMPFTTTGDTGDTVPTVPIGHGKLRGGGVKVSREAFIVCWGQERLIISDFKHAKQPNSIKQS